MKGNNSLQNKGMERQAERLLEGLAEREGGFAARIRIVRGKKGFWAAASGRRNKRGKKRERYMY